MGDVQISKIPEIVAWFLGFLPFLRHQEQLWPANF
jgi:hypothetical protein